MRDQLVAQAGNDACCGRGIAGMTADFRADARRHNHHDVKRARILERPAHEVKDRIERRSQAVRMILQNSQLAVPAIAFASGDGKAEGHGGRADRRVNRLRDSREHVCVGGWRGQIEFLFV